MIAGVFETWLKGTAECMTSIFGKLKCMYLDICKYSKVHMLFTQCCNIAESNNIKYKMKVNNIGKTTFYR